VAREVQAPIQVEGSLQSGSALGGVRKVYLGYPYMISQYNGDYD